MEAWQPVRSKMASRIFCARDRAAVASLTSPTRDVTSNSASSQLTTCRSSAYWKKICGWRCSSWDTVRFDRLLESAPADACRRSQAPTLYSSWETALYFSNSYGRSCRSEQRLRAEAKLRRCKSLTTTVAAHKSAQSSSISFRP